MRVVLADGASDVRSALRLLLEEEFGAVIVGEAWVGTDLPAVVRQGRPDLLMLEWELAVATGPGCLARLRRAGPDARIIALSRRPEARADALAAGADAFASKSQAPEHLVRLVRSVVTSADGMGTEEEA